MISDAAMYHLWTINEDRSGNGVIVQGKNMGVGLPWNDTELMPGIVS